MNFSCIFIVLFALAFIVNAMKLPLFWRVTLLILEAVLLTVKPGHGVEYEAAFATASPIIASMKGYLRHELHRCVEASDKYLLLVWWETLEDHTVGFRRSPKYQEWKRLLHKFYDPFPVVEHFTQVDLAP